MGNCMTMLGTYLWDMLSNINLVGFKLKTFLFIKLFSSPHIFTHLVKRLSALSLSSKHLVKSSQCPLSLSLSPHYYTLSTFSVFLHSVR
ncbi:hypothetical protein L2E82_13350 [Cichorium intybus]|uniref:Uncharacterized protein n=1 Tax=Cichorium intybus TaxID=13427 RepID=A0ACB9EWY5_CICIN|nr:hypothetical protein L2E82_13350 [Cichorium intybus]